MSRFIDILIFSAMLVASIALVSSMQLFPKDYVDTSASDQISSFDITTLPTNESVNQGTGDVIWFSVMWIYEAFKFVLTMALFVVTVYPALTQIFHVPSILATFLSVGIYLCIIMFYIQYKSGRGTKLFDY